MAELGELLEQLAAGQTVKRPCVFHIPLPPGSSEMPEEVGHMTVELSLSKPSTTAKRPLSGERQCSVYVRTADRFDPDLGCYAAGYDDD